MFKKSVVLSSDQLPLRSDTEDILYVEGQWFKDEFGRTVSLRGVNLSGSAKLPYSPRMPSHCRDGFFNHRDISFVGRPFPLDQADEHFERLRSWGFNFLRFLVSWEAIEHAGPRIYDVEYADYVIKILQKAREYGFKCFIDPHQDTWSRFTGGSGAPGWTLELVGFDLEKLSATGAAIVHNTYHDPKNFPKMIWPTNYYKLACATMFTLFFGGDTFARRCVVDIDENSCNNDAMRLLPVSDCDTWQPTSTCKRIQPYLQEHYINAICFLVGRIKACAPDLLDLVVTGYDTLNEPSRGYIGWETLENISKHQELKLGCCPTAIQGFLSGSGVPCDVEFWVFGVLGPKKQNTKLLNSDGESCWRFGYSCIWEAHGVYDSRSRRCLNDHYFSVHPASGCKVDFAEDFWRVFVRKYTSSIRSIQERAIIFIEPPVNEIPPFWRPEEGDPVERICYAPHWYDGLTLMNKHFSTIFAIDYIGFIRGRYSNVLQALSFGMRGIKNNFSGQLSMIRKEGLAYLGKTPFLIGEIGIPFDMDNKQSYQTGTYTNQICALDANISAMESNLFNFTLWNYCSDNCHEWGDMWNGEDLSLFSKDAPESESKNQLADAMQFSISSLIKQNQDFYHPVIDTAKSRMVFSNSNVDLNLGARALGAFLRPYAVKISGDALLQTFDMHDKKKTFRFAFKPNSRFCKRTPVGATEIFLPAWHYGTPVASALARNSILFNPSYIDSFSQNESGIHSNDSQSLYFDVAIKNGSWSFDQMSQTLHVYHGKHIRNSNAENFICELEVHVISEKDVLKRMDIKARRKRCLIL